MSEYTDNDIPISCGECGEYYTGIPAMINHILEIHTNYTPEEATDFANVWADSAYEQIELENIERADYFKRYGHDWEDVDRDD